MTPGHQTQRWSRPALRRKGGLLACVLGAAFAAIALAAPARHGLAQTAPDQAAPAAKTQTELSNPPMSLGAATNFSQGGGQRLIDAAANLPVRHFRDGIRWGTVERTPGSYRFDRARANYPAALAERGGDLVLTVNWGNPLYDRGQTPHSAAALEAFGKFVAAMVNRYPAITAVEVGNEFNSDNFVNGTVRDAGLAERGRYHLAMVRSAAQAVRAVRPDVRILGGSTHSVPAGYLWPILEAGRAAGGDGAHLLDGLAIHPYKTPIDQLAAQIGVLRRHPAAANMPIEITEFGSNDPARAADDLVRGYATLASLGVASLYWYPLHDRGDGMVPLISPGGGVTGAGEAFRFVQAQLAEKSARDISPDAFTFVHQFGDDTLVLWGEPRSVTITAPGIEARDATGRMLDPQQLQLSADQPIVLLGDQAIALGRDVALGCSTLVADSFYQFSYPLLPGDLGEDAGAPTPKTRFTSFATINGQRADWITRPGQERRNVPWVPYLVAEGQPGLQLSAERMQFPRAGNSSRSIAHVFRPDTAGRYRIEAQIERGAEAQDGTNARFAIGERTVETFTDQKNIAFEQVIDMSSGEAFTISIDPAAHNGSARGMAYRLQAHRLDNCPAAE